MHNLSADIIIDQVDTSYIKVVCNNRGVEHELWNKFSFDVPNAKFSPSFKKRYWDGKIHLYNLKNKQLYSGLIHSIIDYANEKSYTVENNTSLLDTNTFSMEDAQVFADTLSLPHIPREYQLRAFATAVRNNRAVIVSPTASGKSLIAYMLARYYNKKTIIVVPTISLVLQLISDFKSYGYTKEIHGVMSGVDKTTNKDITVSTWQSVYEQPPSFFKNFEVIIGDEAHLFKAKSLVSIMSNMNVTKYKFGMTGTLDGLEVNELVLQGVFGKIEHITTTIELISSGSLAPLKIKILVLKHDVEASKNLVGKTYQEEIEHIISSNPRNTFIRNLSLSLTGNTLVLFSYVEKHGKLLHELIREKCSHNNVFFVSGEVEGTVREDIRKIVERTDNSIIVASYGVFSTGINIKRLHNIVFASPTKSRIRTLQSIGRGLRLSEDKTECKLYDIADDISYNKKKNFTLNHLIERVKMYNSEEFPYELHSIDLIRNSQ